MTFKEFEANIINLRNKRTEIFTSEIRTTDTYDRLSANRDSAENAKEEALLKNLNNICAMIDMPEGLLRLAYDRSSYPEKLIEDIEKNLTEIKKLIPEIF